MVGTDEYREMLDTAMKVNGVGGVTLLSIDLVDRPTGVDYGPEQLLRVVVLVKPSETKGLELVLWADVPDTGLSAGEAFGNLTDTFFEWVELKPLYDKYGSLILKPLNPN